MWTFYLGYLIALVTLITTPLMAWMNGQVKYFPIQLSKTACESPSYEIMAWGMSIASTLFITHHTQQLQMTAIMGDIFAVLLAIISDQMNFPIHLACSWLAFVFYEWHLYNERCTGFAILFACLNIVGGMLGVVTLPEIMKPLFTKTPLGPLLDWYVEWVNIDPNLSVLIQKIRGVLQWAAIFVMGLGMLQVAMRSTCHVEVEKKKD